MRSIFLFAGACLLAACGNGKPGSPAAAGTLPVAPVRNDPARPAAPLPRDTMERNVTPGAVTLTGLGAGDTLRSPFTVAGEAPGYWYFEGQFLLKLYDSAEHLLAMVPAKAQSDWMTDHLVPFRAELRWETYAGNGTLVLEADNPSGDAARAKREEVPVWLK